MEDKQVSVEELKQMLAASRLGNTNMLAEPVSFEFGNRVGFTVGSTVVVAPRARGPQAGDQVAPADLGAGLVGVGPRRAHGHLQLLGGAIAQEQVVLLLDVVDDRLVDLVAGHPDAAGHHDAAQGDDREPNAGLAVLAPGKARRMRS